MFERSSLDTQSHGAAQSLASHAIDVSRVVGGIEIRPHL
jgi:hypothetical protein